MELDLATFASYTRHLAAILLGLAVLAAAPRQAANRGFAIYVLATTARPLGFVIADSIGFGWDGYTIRTHVWWTQIVAAIGLVLLVRAFPTPLRRADRLRVVTACSIGAVVAIAWAVWGAPSTMATGGGVVWIAFGLTAGALPMGITAAFLALLALRARHTADSVAPHAVVTVAIVLPWAMEIARRLGVIAGRAPAYPGEYVLTVALAAATLGIVTLLWVLNLQAIGRSRWALVAAWCGPALALAGVLSWSTITRGTDWLGTASDVASLVAIAVVAFAIANGQVPGLARKIRWGVSRGTVAAVFVAVFFVGSEAAQQFFGETSGSTYVGIAAAGALVFAFAPLQRAAERLAARAVPSGASNPGGTMAAAEADYRHAVRLALRDRTLTRDEERHLIRLAHHAGILPARAMEIHDEVEREAKPVPGKGAA